MTFFEKLCKIENMYYDNEIPSYMKVGNGVVTVTTEDGKHRITAKDVAKYYATQANNIYSGFRRIGTIGGDWRPIDNLASELLEIFKVLSLDKLKRESRKMGIEPRF